MMRRLGILWTAAIAYVALAVGAGLSIMYNVLQVTADRGPALDWSDIVTAVAMPGLVVLMVELYVSTRWRGLPWYFQAMRVIGLGGIGAVAMRASWTHGHEWLLSRGQTPDVAIAWPLAIDALAIMATALLLAGRRPLASGQDRDGQAVATARPMSKVATVDTLADDVVAIDDPVATRPLGEYDAWAAGYERAVDALGRDLADETERFLADGTHVPVIQGPADPLPRRTNVPAEAEALLTAWRADLVPAADADALLAAHFGRTVRTVRRWRTAIRPSS